MRSHQTPRPFFLFPKGRYLGTCALCSSNGESASCEHVSTTYGAKPVEGFWRVRRGKISDADQVARGSQKHNLHRTHVSLVSSLNGISNSFKLTHSFARIESRLECFFSDSSHTRCKSATRDPIAGELRLQGERHPDGAQSLRQQSGRRRRRCTC